MSIAIYTGLIVPIVYNSLHPGAEQGYTSQELFQKSMMTMTGLGVGEIVGGIVMGVVVDKIGPKKSSLINCVLIIIQTIIVIFYIRADNYSGIAYLMTFAWGL